MSFSYGEHWNYLVLYFFFFFFRTVYGHPYTSEDEVPLMGVVEDWLNHYPTLDIVILNKKLHAYYYQFLHCFCCLSSLVINCDGCLYTHSEKYIYLCVLAVPYRQRFLNSDSRYNFIKTLIYKRLVHCHNNIIFSLKFRSKRRDIMVIWVYLWLW